MAVVCGSEYVEIGQRVVRFVYGLLIVLFISACLLVQRRSILVEFELDLCSVILCDNTRYDLDQERCEVTVTLQVKCLQGREIGRV